MPLDDAGFRERCEPLDKIDRVIDLLATEGRWCQGQLATGDGRRCIMAAIRAVDGSRMLTRPVITCDPAGEGRRFSWINAGNIPRFNDDPATNHALVLRVLFQARENVISQIAEKYAVPTWRRRLRRLYHALPVS